MKRHGNLFSQIVDKDNLYLAFLKARKGKGWFRWANTHNLKLSLEIDQKVKEFSQ
jgi:hypothetical protein